MRIAILADIHANFPALEAVFSHIEKWDPDRVIVAGDIVNRGPQSLACLDLVERMQNKSDWQVIKGNHEDYVIAQSTPDAPKFGPLSEIYRIANWAYHQLGCDVKALEDMPDEIKFDAPDGSLVYVYHASEKGNRVGLFPFSTDVELRRKIGAPAPSLICVGHTHVPFIRKVDDTLVVNVGSVGIPFDGDWRAAYAQLQFVDNCWEAKIVRLSYDFHCALSDYLKTGFLQEAGPISWLVLAEFLFARSQLFTWMRDYYEFVEDDEMDIERAVEDQLVRQGMWSIVKRYL